MEKLPNLVTNESLLLFIGFLLIIAVFYLFKKLSDEKVKSASLYEKAANAESVGEQLLQKEQQLQSLKEQNIELKMLLEKEREITKEKIDMLAKAEEKFKDTFASLSSKALNQNNQSFLDLAKQILEKYQNSALDNMAMKQKEFAGVVEPIKEALSSVDKKISEIEKSRIGAYEAVTNQVKNLVDMQRDLRTETANLAKALRSPTVRGRWGEMQLRRVVEMSGLSPHCDFFEQHNVKDEVSGSTLRPDMVIRLPNSKSIIVDAKTPLQEYLNAVEATDKKSQEEHMRNHARHVKKHISMLSAKSYWNQFKGETPEFVVLFLPGETFFNAALEYEPDLIEEGVKHNVIIATPATLIALLHAIAYGWRQEKIAENAKEIESLGKEMYKRISDMGSHMAKLGSQLGLAVSSYNKTLGTMERRILPTARKFKELSGLENNSDGGSGDDIPVVPVDINPRDIEALELSNISSDKKSGDDCDVDNNNLVAGT